MQRKRVRADGPAGTGEESGRERLVAAALALSVSMFCGAMFAKAASFQVLLQEDAVGGGWWKGALAAIRYTMEYETGQKLEHAPFSGPSGLLMQLAVGFSTLFLAAGYMTMRRNKTSAVIAIFVFIQLMAANDAESKLPLHVEGGHINILVKSPSDAGVFFEILATSHLFETSALIVCTAISVYACIEEELILSKAVLLVALGFCSGLSSRATGVDAAILGGSSSADVRKFACAHYGTVASVVFGGELSRVPILTACATFVLVTVLARVASLFALRTGMAACSTACVAVGVAFGVTSVEPNLHKLVEAGSEAVSGQFVEAMQALAEGHRGEFCAWALAAVCAFIDLLARPGSGRKAKEQ